MSPAERQARRRRKVAAEKQAAFDRSPEVEIWFGLEIRKLPEVMAPPWDDRWNDL